MKSVFKLKLFFYIPYCIPTKTVLLSVHSSIGYNCGILFYYYNVQKWLLIDYNLNSYGLNDFTLDVLHIVVLLKIKFFVTKMRIIKSRYSFSLILVVIITIITVCTVFPTVFTHKTSFKSTGTHQSVCNIRSVHSSIFPEYLIRYYSKRFHSRSFLPHGKVLTVNNLSVTHTLSHSISLTQCHLIQSVIALKL